MIEWLKTEDARPGATMSRRRLLSGALPGALALLAPPYLAAASAAPPMLFGGLLTSLSEPGSCVEHKARERLVPRLGETLVWMPWPRAYRCAERGNALLFPLIRTPGRERDWQWIAPLLTDALVLVLAPAGARAGHRAADLQDLQIGTIRDSFISARLADLGFHNVEFAPSERTNARKLGLGRLDAWATLERVALAPEHQPFLPAGYVTRPLDERPLTLWLAASRDLDARAYTVPAAPPG